LKRGRKRRRYVWRTEGFGLLIEDGVGSEVSSVLDLRERCERWFDAHLIKERENEEGDGLSD
jgi:hypothetical protein